MTIGIAARGPRAGEAILRALAAAERVASGAIGGYVSLAAIDAGGQLRRADIQRGGATALLAGEMDERLIAAPLAVLMSSGPDRPEPLSQFTPGTPGVGLVTGHRFPNMPGSDGLPINEGVLRLMAGGSSPRSAVDAVLHANPTADAGLIALAIDGSLAVGNTAYLSTFPGLGHAVLRSPADTGVLAAVVCNAIAPVGSLAPFVAELVLDRMDAGAPVTDGILIEAGIPVRTADRPAVAIDASGRARSIALVIDVGRPGDLSAGYGPLAPVIRDDRLVGRTLAEPYLVIRAGRLASVDGASSARIPIRTDT